MKETLEQGLASFGLTASPVAIQKLVLYSKLLLAQNQVMNLTAITDPSDICELHFLDSAALLSFVDMKGASLFDVGTGAGFPGLVVKILEPSLRLTLLDSLKKRMDWLSSVCDRLELSQVNLIHGRAEELAHDPSLRDSFDFATARAVAALPQLSELCLPYVRLGGSFLAMKTQRHPEEISSAEPVITLLGGGTPKVWTYALPFSKIPRSLLSIPKKCETPIAYPRKWSKIKQAKI